MLIGVPSEIRTGYQLTHRSDEIMCLNQHCLSSNNIPFGAETKGEWRKLRALLFVCGGVYTHTAVDTVCDWLLF
jgi:hypothetical protein